MAEIGQSIRLLLTWSPSHLLLHLAKPPIIIPYSVLLITPSQPLLLPSYYPCPLPTRPRLSPTQEFSPSTPPLYFPLLRPNSLITLHFYSHALTFVGLVESQFLLSEHHCAIFPFLDEIQFCSAQYSHFLRKFSSFLRIIAQFCHFLRKFSSILRIIAQFCRAMALLASLMAAADSAKRGFFASGISEKRFYNNFHSFSTFLRI